MPSSLSEFTQHAAAITRHWPGSTLTLASTTFAWSSDGGNVTYYALWVGSTLGNYDLKDVSPTPLTATSVTVNLPTNGAPIYAELWTAFSGGNQISNSSAYAEATQ